MNVKCVTDVCPVFLGGTCVFYTGETLVYTGIQTNDNINTALSKIDSTIGDPIVSISANYADDSAAATGGIPVGGLYHTSGTVKIRLT